jgi:hypothetical protein
MKALHNTLLASAVVFGFGFGFGAFGCYTEEPEPQYYAGVEDGGTDLVEVSPGVEVIVDYDEPIFFVDNFYWVYRGGYWYQSTWYGGGWVRGRNVPVTVTGISHPEQYTHYRPAGWAVHEHVQGGYHEHEQYHASHPSSGYKARAAVHGGHHK